MAKRRKGAVRMGHGAMCNICGKNCGKGGALKKHIEEKHDVDYDTYNKCFYPKEKNVIFDEWNDSISTASGKTVMTHVLVRRFVGSPGRRGVAKTAR